MQSLGFLRQIFFPAEYITVVLKEEKQLVFVGFMHAIVFLHSELSEFYF